MAQVPDYIIANGSGSSVRSDINDTFDAVKSSNSGTSAPGAAVAGMLWLDTSVSPAVLKRVNASATDWVEVNSDTVPAGTVRGNSTAFPSAETNVTMAQLKSMLGFSQDLGANGYEISPSGLIVQYVRFAFGPFTNSGSSVVTFPTTFPNSYRTSVFTPETTNNSVTITTSSGSNSQITVQFRESTGSSTTGFANGIIVGS